MELAEGLLMGAAVLVVAAGTAYTVMRDRVRGEVHSGERAQEREWHVSKAPVAVRVQRPQGKAESRQAKRARDRAFYWGKVMRIRDGKLVRNADGQVLLRRRRREIAFLKSGRPRRRRKASKARSAGPLVG